ncbi:MAG: OmpH family outer membrane protein [Gammaproteobacteria bacterium]|nr:OmpH family outer membrane protein [Gammaproteobacteria bacterium]
MKKLVSALFLMSILTVPAASFAQKIGFVNVNILFNEYAKVKGIDKMLEDKFNGPKQDLEKLVIDIKALEKEIKTNELLMTESKLTSSKNKLKQMIGEYREKGTALEKELKVMRNKEMTDFRAVVFDVTKKFAAEKKYDLILNEGVMFAADKANITDEISALVNKAAK